MRRAQYWDHMYSVKISRQDADGTAEKIKTIIKEVETVFPCDLGGRLTVIYSNMLAIIKKSQEKLGYRYFFISPFEIGQFMGATISMRAYIEGKPTKASEPTRILWSNWLRIVNNLELQMPGERKDMRILQFYSGFSKVIKNCNLLPVYIHPELKYLPGKPGIIKYRETPHCNALVYKINRDFIFAALDGPARDIFRVLMPEGITLDEVEIDKPTNVIPTQGYRKAKDLRGRKRRSKN